MLCPLPLLTACRSLLFQVMDVESTGGLDALEICNGMRKLVRELAGARRGGVEKSGEPGDQEG